jgi:protein-disulfide isomerase
MRGRIVFCIILVLLFGAGGAHAGVEMAVVKTFDTGAAPLDAVMSHDGKRIFILTGEELRVHAAESGEIEARIGLSGHFDTLRLAAMEDRLLLGSSSRKILEIVTLDYIRKIDTAGSPFKGPEDAPVVLTVFGDFECGACAGLAPLIDEMSQSYPDLLKIVFKNFPLAGHRNSRAAAAAAIAAARQGKFWELHDRLFAYQASLSPQKIGEAARQAGLDPARVQQDMKDVLILSALSRDISQGVRAGVRGTPTVFVNGRLARDLSRDGIRSLIEKELSSSPF